MDNEVIKAFSLFDSLFQIISLIIFFGALIIPVLVLIFIVRLIRKHDARVEERKTFEKEILALQQEQIKQLTELNDRLEEIKRLLKETK